METYIIGVDHGNAAMKTSRFCFPSGIVEYENEPYTLKGVLEYEGRFYVCGSGRQPLVMDKTATDNFYLLTLAAMTKEIACRTDDSQASVILAAGLPLTSFGRDKSKFKRYLLRDGAPVSFRFEGKPYEITVEDVLLFPQGYAAVLLHQDMLAGEPSVVLADIGGWTVDVMRLDHSLPDASTCRSLELGMIRCLDEAGEQVRRRLGLSLTAAQIESVLRDEPCGVDDRAKEIVQAEGRRYAQRLLSAIAESGLDTRAIPAIFMGGGAAIMKRHVPPQDGLCRAVILDDVCANAKGYERLAGQLSRSDGHAG